MLHGQLHVSGSFVQTINCMCILGGCVLLFWSRLWAGMADGDACGACRWPLLFPIVSLGVLVGPGASLLQFGSGRLSRLPHQWDQSLRVM